MYFLLGISRMELCDYGGAIEYFLHTRGRLLRPNLSQSFLVVSLASFLTDAYGLPNSLVFSDRYLDGNQIILTTRLDSVFAKLCIQQVAQRMQGMLSSRWSIPLTRERTYAAPSSMGFQVSFSPVCVHCV